MSLVVYDDAYFMKQALEEAEKALLEDEVPVGAVIAINQKIIAKAHNQTEKLNDVTAHAEMLAITSAANYLNHKYLKNCTLYVTLEPCVMCMGALNWSQISRVVFAASDPQRGFMAQQIPMHPKMKIETGLFEEKAKHLLEQFFESKRR